MAIGVDVLGRLEDAGCTDLLTISVGPGRCSARLIGAGRLRGVAERKVQQVVNPERLRELGFHLQARAEIGESDRGAWLATASDGTPVVLKWFPDESVVDRYALLLPALDRLRCRGVPVPEYIFVGAVDGWTLSAQRVLPGRSWQRSDGHGALIAPPQMIDRVFEWVAAAEGIGGPPPSPSLRTWGEFMIHTLTIGEDGWVMHEPMRSWDSRSARLLERVEAVGVDAEASWFPTCGLAHLDLHTGNLLACDDGTPTGIIDWEGACAGDHRFDLATFAFDLDGVGQQIWDRLERLIEPRLLRVYVAHMALRGTDWAIRYHPDDVPRQLDRAERILKRCSA